MRNKIENISRKNPENFKNIFLLLQKRTKLCKCNFSKAKTRPVANDVF